MKKWLNIGIVVWGLWGAYYVYYKNWAALEAIFTWMLAGGLFFAILQIIEARRSTDKQLNAAKISTNAQLAVELFKELRSEKTLEIIRDIYNLTPKEVCKLSRKHKHDIEYVLDRFELIGVVVTEKIIDENLAIDYAGGTALRCWHQLHQYIKEVRKSRGSFRENFEALARLCLDYFDKAGVKTFPHHRALTLWAGNS